MTYPLINGETINGEEDGGGVISFAGLDVGVAGTAVVRVPVDVGSAYPTEFGDLATAFPIAPAGLDVGISGTHSGLFQKPLPFDGLDLGVAGVPSVRVTAYPQSAQPLEFGPFRAQNGVDVEVTPSGLNIGRTGLHGAIAGQPAPVLAVQVASVRPLEIGALSVVRSGTVVEPASALPLEIGPLATGIALTVAGAHPLEIGGINTAVVVSVQSATPVQMGGMTTQSSVAPAGIDIGVSGTHSANADGITIHVGSAQPLELGGFGALGFAAYVRSARPMKIGPISIDRGSAC